MDTLAHQRPTTALDPLIAFRADEPAVDARRQVLGDPVFVGGIALGEAGELAPARKVLLVDDHDLVRLGIRALMGSSRRVMWLEAASLADAVELYHEHSDIALVLLDLNLADCKGLQGLARLLNAHPSARVVVLSGTQDEFVVRQAKAMGAAGYLHKCAPPQATRDTLLAAFDAACLPSASPGAAWSHFPKSASTSRYELVSDLGPKRLEILELILSGCTNQEISRETHLSLGTVKNYVSTILLALDVKSRSHLISLFR